MDPQDLQYRTLNLESPISHYWGLATIFTSISERENWIYTKENQDLSSSSKYRDARALVENPPHTKQQIGEKVST